VGTYEVYRGLERIEVVNRGGMLYLEQTYPMMDEAIVTPLIPEDPTLASTDFYTLSNGIKSPIEFAIRDDGKIDLFIGRYCYHKVD
jgi:hypothetical protein